MVSSRGRRICNSEEKITRVFAFIKLGYYIDIEQVNIVAKIGYLIALKEDFDSEEDNTIFGVQR